MPLFEHAFRLRQILDGFQQEPCFGSHRNQGQSAVFRAAHPSSGRVVRPALSASALRQTETARDNKRRFFQEDTRPLWTSLSSLPQHGLNGLFVRGVVMSSIAKVFNRKDGSGKVVCIRHEIVLQPGMAVWEEYPDLKDGKVKLDGDNVVEFHKLPEFQQVTLKVLRWEERDKRFIIQEVQIVG